MSKAERKSEYFDRLFKLLDDHRSVLVCNVDNVGSNQMHQIRASLRKQATVLMGKNTMIRKAVRSRVADIPALERLLPLIKGNIGLVFTNGDLKDTREKIVSNRVRAPAKAGAVAPCDVIIPAGNTGMEPGKTSFFQALGVPTKIARGTIEIVSDVHLVKAGSKVGPSEATLLNMLNISPFTYGLTVTNVYDDGNVFEPEILDITDEYMMEKFTAGISEIASLSLALHFPTIAAVPHLLINNYKELVAISLASDYVIDQVKELKELLDNPEALAAAQAAAASSAPAASSAAAEDKPAAKKEEVKEESDDDMGFEITLTVAVIASSDVMVAAWDGLWITAVYTIGYQLIFFLVAYFNRFDKVTDLAGSTNFLINALISFFILPANLQSSQKILATCCTALWAIRLAVFLLIRVMKAGDDKRFDEMRGKFWSFLGFWVFQMFWVWTVGLTVVLLNSNPAADYSFGSAPGDIIGLIMFLIGLTVEAVSDQQKFNYRFQVAPEYRRQKRQAPIIKRGLWRYSRQPNYFGEILLWWGMFVLCLDHQPVQNPVTYWSIISPLFITLLLLLVSGLPLAERGMQKRYLAPVKEGEGTLDQEARQDYLDYRQSTSPLIPLPNSLYKRLPAWFKRWLLFEWQLYETEWLHEAMQICG